MKAKVKFVCQNCGYESARWLGKCSECNSWNSFVEEKTVTEKSQKYTFEAGKTSKVSAITDIEGREEDRYNTGINELNKVLGGGLVIGSLVLIGGEPGIGKSTLVLQMCNELSKKYGSVLYISGEESISQIKMRANRLKAVSKDIFPLKRFHSYQTQHLRNAAILPLGMNFRNEVYRLMLQIYLQLCGMAGQNP